MHFELPMIVTDAGGLKEMVIDKISGLIVKKNSVSIANGILEYFKNCETSSLDVAREELSDLDLDWEQLKIMRIKFLSEFGI
jgi:glycosyltransferase involved in cell wall biosynthesis